MIWSTMLLKHTNVNTYVVYFYNFSYINNVYWVMTTVLMHSILHITRLRLQCQTPLRSYLFTIEPCPLTLDPYPLCLIPWPLSFIPNPISLSSSTVPFKKFWWGFFWSLLLPHSGSILDSQPGWESGKFQLASCSCTIITEPAAHPPSRQPNM